MSVLPKTVLGEALPRLAGLLNNGLQAASTYAREILRADRPSSGRLSRCLVRARGPRPARKKTTGKYRVICSEHCQRIKVWGHQHEPACKYDCML